MKPVLPATTPSPRVSLRFIHATAWAATALLGCATLAQAQNEARPAGSASMPHKAEHHAESPAKIKSEGSYSLGVNMGETLRRNSLDASAISTARLMQGLRAGLDGKATTGAADKENIRTLILSNRTRQGAANHAKARAFLARNGKKKGVITTASGLEYEVLKPGHGKAAVDGESVTVNYRGKLLDGTVFDSSYKRGEPATFPVDQVIPGWQEALKLMKPGAKWRIFIPPQLGYDLRSPPPIPPGSALVFDVDLISVQPGKAPAQPPAPPSPPNP